MEILNSSQMAKADSFAINEIGIPSSVLMENAAITVTDEILTRMPDIVSAAVVAGSGNNGGDGLAVARLLINAGLACDVYMDCDESKLKGDCLLNYNILKNYNAPIFIIEGKEIPTFSDYDITIDALFGTGLSRPLKGFYAALVQRINLTSNFVVSLDIPSGLSGDTHNIIGECVDADLTVTFARPKFPHIMFPAREMCGEVVVTDISIPDFAIDSAENSVYLLDEDTLPMIPPRETDSHKGHFGHAVITGGSQGKSGAVFIASRACARCGAGLTTTAIPGGLISAAEAVNPEIMSFATGKGTHFTSDTVSELIDFVKDKTVCAIGPGIGKDKDTRDFVRELVKQTKLPLVIDADGLNLLDARSIKKLSGRAVLTPHIGEFAEMIGKTTEEVLSERLELAKVYAENNGVVLVLKSSDTLIALPDGAVYVNITGTPALSKGGSGDCLTGLISAFISQRYDLAEAACLGTYILGRTAEIISEEMNERTILTTDIIENIGKTLDELAKNT
ncbi:MAG: bifunctional ADP-dependent NAD(P)H-hydrate dehydratase/NAD(P)H-hydrate epimerase [Denitrovibrio sp.]|nr:MAG: bifunctional ADP-dependent NAD(P)H-hydrate dehydratase/NAD(P)H-hydrate epimerase [Denitrovibrio sp.]